jgi:hypothetical protein
MMTAFKATKTTELVSADAGHGEGDEGSENDGRLDHDHHGAGCVRKEQVSIVSLVMVYVCEILQRCLPHPERQVSLGGVVGR